MRKLPTFMTAFTASALLFSGCSDRDVGIGGRRSVLQAFQSCGDLERSLETAALDQIGRSYYWGWGWGWGRGGALEGDAQFDGAEGAEGEGEAPPAPTNGGEFTGTNVQELGVDEADFVKSIHPYIYVLHGQKLVILDGDPAEETSIISETDLEGWPSQMFISGDLALVLGDGAYQDGGFEGMWRPQVLATVLDLGSDRTAPSVVRQSRIDGGLIGARMVGSSARVVTSYYTPVYDLIDWDVDVGRPVPQPPDCGWEEPDPMGWGSDCDAEWERYEREMAAYEEARIQAVRSANEERIRALSLNDLLPQIETTVDGSETTGAVSECTSFYRTTVESGYGLVSVNTFDLDNPADELDATTVVGDYGIIYASKDQLYLAMAQYPEWTDGWPANGEVLQTTAIHQFDLSAPRVAPYIASGEVAGRLNNSFSMDEHGGYLRIATTVDRATQDWGVSRDNTFSVLAPNEGLLEVVGRIEGIAPDEQIYSARLFDDEGYLVTFRVIDPLFAIDLRDPANPVITGELKIPGFSQYMHPLGSDHLLTVGVDADEGGFTEGLQLSIFNVSDPAAPELAFTEPLGQGYSEAQYEHKAFTFKPTSETGDEGILALPMSNWDTGGGAELLVFDVSATTGFRSMGSVDHSDLFTNPEDAYCWLRDVRRSVMSEDHVYSISYGGYKVNPLADLGQTAASGNFPDTDLCGYYGRGEPGIPEDF